jgi:acetyl-CoA carboxylase biotin carboxyl carrier protein
MLEEIEKLVELVARSNVAEVTLRWEGHRITVRKPAGGQRHMGVPAAASAPAVLDPPLSSAVPEPRWITAPMVGIFHPVEPPVAAGVRVEAGQVVGMIESMKLMNDVCSEEGGIVQEVLVEPGMPVEYGQPLFALVGEERCHGGR